MMKALPSHLVRATTRTNGSYIVAVAALLAYVAMLLGAYDTTFHSVDSVRDVAIARAIADGHAFPLVSQPWAATFQTPPAYLYLLSIPFALGGSEGGAFVFVALLCLVSVTWLWRLTHREYGAATGSLYAATALVFPTSIFFHSAGNPSLAFAASTFALGCVIRVSQGSRSYSAPLVLMLFLLPQLHLSSVPIAAALGLWLLIGGRQRLTATAIAIGALLGVLSAIWLWKFGIYAPEYVQKTGSASDAGALASRFTDPSQWVAMATVYLNYAKHLLNVPSWLVAFVAITTLYFVIGLAVSPLLLLQRIDSSGWQIVIATALFTVLLGLAYLDSWGVWYFDSWLPWIVVAAAIAWGKALQRVGKLSWVLPIAASIAFFNIAPQIWLHAKLARQGYIEVSPSALFASRHSAAAAPTIPVLSARHQLAYRDFVAVNDLCLDDLAGVSAWYLRDMSRRDGYVHCKKTNQSSQQLLYLQLVGFGTTVPMPTHWQSGPLRLQLLPPQPKVWIDGEERRSKYGETLARYGLYLPVESTEPSSVSFAPSAGVVNRLNIALRCIGGEGKVVPQWVHENVIPARVSNTVDRTLFALRYLEYQIEYGTSLNPPEQIRLRLGVSLNCDTSVFVQ